MDSDVLSAGHSADRTGAPSLDISNAVSRLHKQFVGGPTNVRTTIEGAEDLHLDAA